MKKIFSVLTAVIMLLVGNISVFASDSEGTSLSGNCGDNATWFINTDNTLVISGNGELNSGGYSSPWYQYSVGIKKVVVEEGITGIDSKAFINCLNIEEAVIPSTLETLGVSGLPNNGSRLTDVWCFSKNIKNTFSGNSGSYPQAGSGIKWHVYKDSTTEASLKVGLKYTDEDFEYLTNETFPTETNRTPIVLPKETETSGPAGLGCEWSWDEASKTLTFSGSGDIIISDGFKKLASKIEKVEMKDSTITSICNCAFGPFDQDNSGKSASICPNLKSVTFPETLKEIGDHAFNKSALSVENLEFPEGLESIGNMAFYDTNLKGNLKLPSTLNYIGQSAFQNTDITSVNLIEGMTLGGIAFADCNSLKELTVPKDIHYNVTGVSNMMRGNAAFSGCEGLERVTIKGGGTVKIHLSGERENGLSQRMFDECKSLKEIIIETDNLSFVQNYADSERTFDLTSNPTFYIIKDSTTEKTLRNAGYLTGTNVVYIANKSALTEAVNSAEEMDTTLYINESVSSLDKAVEAAKAVLEDINATQESADNAAKAIKDAIAALKYKPADYTKVDEAIAKIPADLSIYTDESVSALNAAVDSVDRTKNITEQSIVDGYAKDIEDAVAALTERPKGNIAGAVVTPKDEAEVTVTVTTDNGETVTEVTAVNGEYSISDLEDGEYVITFSSEGYVTRSYTVTVANGSLALEAEIHKSGDINGDGNITTVDVGLSNAHAKGTKTLEGYDFYVAEVSGDEKITTVDVGMINATAKGVR